MVRADSLRKKVYDSWVKNPYLKPKKVCENLGLTYADHGNYVHKLLSEYRSYYQFGSPQEAHLPHRRVFVWEKVEGDRAVALGRGWSVVANVNGMMVFRDDRGSVHWYKKNLVRLYLRGEVKLARAKELFCRAFSWFSSEQLSEYLDAPLREESKHWVFELGAPLPRFDVRTFEKNFGIRIFSDGSHPTSLEVEETEPFWIDRVNESISNFGKLHEQFGENLREHLRLIKLWQREAKGMRVRSKVCGIKEQPAQRNLLDWMV